MLHQKNQENEELKANIKKANKNSLRAECEKLNITLEEAADAMGKQRNYINSKTENILPKIIQNVTNGNTEMVLDLTTLNEDLTSKLTEGQVRILFNNLVRQIVAQDVQDIINNI